MTTTMQTTMSLTAADLMTSPLAVIPCRMSMRAAAQMLLDEQIHGAPVVDENGKCVGVISTTDFLYAIKKCRKRTDAADNRRFFCSWQIVDPADVPEESVGDYMTQDCAVVAPSTPINELARMMLEAHVHRLLIVEQENHPIGMVSCTDILAAVARAEVGAD